MAARLNEVLTVAGQNLTIFCGNQSYVGVGLSGTFVGTLNFAYSVDGVNFQPASLTPFASGTPVTSATTTGNWFTGVLNYVAVRVTLSAYTSGSVIVQMATSQDASYQDAFLAASTICKNSVASNALNTLTQAAQTNRAWRLRTLKITAGGQPSWLTSPNVQILDGTTLLWAFDLPLSGSAGIIYDIALPVSSPSNPGGGIINTPGNSFVIKVAAAGSGVNTNINAEFSAA